MQLRPYQIQARDKLREHIVAGVRRLLLVLPTGGGKTVSAADIAITGLSRSRRVGFLARQRELVRQPFCKLLRYGVPDTDVGIIMAGVALPEPTLTLPMTGIGPLDARRDDEIWSAFARRRPDAPMQIMSAQTLCRYDDVPFFDLLFIDEAHESLCKSVQSIIAKCTAKNPDIVIIGLTATPIRGDRRGLGECFEVMVAPVTYRQLAAGGHLDTPTIYTARKLPDLSDIRTIGGDYDAKQLDGMLADDRYLIGDVVEHWQKRGNNAPTLVFGAGVMHSRALARAFQAAGIGGEHVDGDMPTAQRDDIFARLDSGELLVVCNVDVATQGFDCPKVKTISDCAPTKSLRKALQRWGRGSRPHAGGLPFTILDHAGNCMEHGSPQMDRAWSLESRKRKGKSISIPRMWQCQICLTTHELTVSVCMCGYERPQKAKRDLIRTIPGELHRFEDLQAEAWAMVVEEWKSLATKRSEAWCYKRFRKLYGFDPPDDAPRPSGMSGSRVEWPAAKPGDCSLARAVVEAQQRVDYAV